VRDWAADRAPASRGITSSRTAPSSSSTFGLLTQACERACAAAVERIVNAEAQASGAPRPPEITPLGPLSAQVNDKAASDRIAEAFRAHFSPDRVRHAGPAPASEDFGCFGTEWHAPSVSSVAPILFCMPKRRRKGRIKEWPVNHSPKFLPVPPSDIANGGWSPWSSRRWRRIESDGGCWAAVSP
jgi:hypothetical protein